MRLDRFGDVRSKQKGDGMAQIITRALNVEKPRRPEQA